MANEESWEEAFAAPTVRVMALRELSDVVVHGHAQVTTQALRLCASEEVPVHYVTTSGAYLGSFAGLILDEAGA
jgi:CRISPR/Cas system-associated endonuclease Cas1